jgi:hypothetical protein
VLAGIRLRHFLSDTQGPSRTVRSVKHRADRLHALVEERTGDLDLLPEVSGLCWAALDEAVRHPVE